MKDWGFFKTFSTRYSHNKRISIDARGLHSETLFRIILKKWKEVNEPFEDKVKVTPMILCTCATCADLDMPHTFRYQSVLNAKQQKQTLQCNESFKAFKAEDILKGVYDETTVLLDSLKGKKKEQSSVLDLIRADELDKAIAAISSPEYNVLFERRLQEWNRNSGLGTLSFEQKTQARNALAKDLVGYFTTDRAYERWKKGQREMLSTDDGFTSDSNRESKDINEDNPIIEKEPPPVQVIVNNNPPQNPTTKTGEDKKERYGFLKWLIPVLLSSGILFFAYLNYSKEQPKNTNQTQTNEMIDEEQLKPKNEKPESNTDKN